MSLNNTYIDDVEEIDGWNAGFCRDVVAVQEICLSDPETNQNPNYAGVIQERVMRPRTVQSYEKRRVAFTCEDFDKLPDAFNR